MTANATSHALAALRLRGVVRAERSGRERRWRIASDDIHTGTLCDTLPAPARAFASDAGIALRYGSGLTNRAIAKLLGLSETNVGTILHRAITTLRERWPEEVS